MEGSFPTPKDLFEQSTAKQTVLHGRALETFKANFILESNAAVDAGLFECAVQIDENVATITYIMKHMQNLNFRVGYDESKKIMLIIDWSHPRDLKTRFPDLIPINKV